MSATGRLEPLGGLDHGALKGEGTVGRWAELAPGPIGALWAIQSHRGKCGYGLGREHRQVHSNAPARFTDLIGVVRSATGITLERAKQVF